MSDVGHGLEGLMYGVPKAELHVHAEACMEPELVLRFAERNGITLPYASEEEIREAYDWPDLGAFLDRYYRHIEVLRTALDFQELVESYVERASVQGVRHVEMFFDPQAHTRRGVALETVVDGLSNGLEIARHEHGITGSLLACFLRELGPEAAVASFEELRALPDPDRVIGIGLDSIERGYPPTMFEAVYRLASEAGLHRVIHAGEDDAGAYVGVALSRLDVERVDHGVRCGEDPGTMEQIHRRGTTLTVCPFANVRTGIYPTLAEHPVADLLRAGVKVTINSDGPAYFGGYVADNWAAVAEAFALTAEEVVGLARNSVDGSFADAERKAQLHEEIDEYLTRAAVPA